MTMGMFGESSSNLKSIEEHGGISKRSGSMLQIADNVEDLEKELRRFGDFRLKGEQR